MGAKASVLTRYIKPKQVAAGAAADHRSEVVIVGRYADGKSQYYEIVYVEDEEEKNVMSAAARFVRIIEEGDESGIVSGAAKERKKQPKKSTVKWQDSKAKEILMNDVASGVVDDSMTPEDVYTMKPEYAEYWERFPSRLSSVRKSVKDLEAKAAEDQRAYEIFVEKHPVATHSHKGYIQWKGSESRRLVLIDLEAKKHEEPGTFRTLWESREIYKTEFPFKAFRDKCKQEIRTSKYVYTMRIKGKGKQHIVFPEYDN